eukprot:363309-Chlamydomonas_euryale.AAC.25
MSRAFCPSICSAHPTCCTWACQKRPAGFCTQGGWCRPSSTSTGAPAPASSARPAAASPCSAGVDAPRG